MLSLRKQRADSRLICIGDDWQAIIRFAGGDIRVMTQFAERVGPFWQGNLEQTFRYSQIIAKVSTEFVVANPNQLKKGIVPSARSMNLPVRIVFSPGEEEKTATRKAPLNAVISELKIIAKKIPEASVLLLCRYRYGMPASAAQAKLNAEFPNLKLTWATVHSSKGREADAVIVTDLCDDLLGFPCLRDDDPLIRRYLPPEDSHEHAEERRLFYVAMTRAKHHLSLIADAHSPSPFVEELKKRHRNWDGLVVIAPPVPTKPCPKCKAGFIKLQDGANGRFFSCSKSPVCDHKEKVCPHCEQAFWVREHSDFVCSNQAGDCNFRVPACPRCSVGWLVLRTNQKTGNQFWGCSRFNADEDPCRYSASN